MEENAFSAVWNWLGGEFASFGLRWLVVVAVMLICNGFWGWKYHHLKKGLEALEESKVIAQPVANNFNPVFSPTNIIKAPSQTHSSNIETASNVIDMRSSHTTFMDRMIGRPMGRLSKKAALIF
ncbi:MAG: hypothetical protein OXH76_24260 [Boseongicola sp.]|nr:hypothetical protein [Boseongicola sp.]